MSAVSNRKFPYFKLYINNLSKFSAKSIGENYVMNYTDFSDPDTSLYGIASLADSPSGNAPDNNVGDFKILRLGTNNEKYNTLMLSSPRFDGLYIGKFWEGNWKGWKQLASTSDLNDTISDRVKITWNSNPDGLLLTVDKNNKLLIPRSVMTGLT